MKKIIERLLAVWQQPSQRRRLIRIGSVLAVLALAWTLVVGWWLPGFLQPRIEAAASEALGAPLKIERLQISPWELEARVQGLRLGPEAAPWLRVAELRADISSESLWRLAPVLARLQLREPRIELERIDAKHYNITPMLEALAKRPPAPPGSQPARFAVHNIRLDGGRIHVVDRVSKTEHLVDALQLGIPFISNLPSKVNVDVEPLLDAQIDGSHLRVQGETLPFTEGLRSTVAVNWQQLDVQHWLAAATPLLPKALPFEVERGRLDLALQIAFERREPPAVSSLHIAGGASLSQLQARLPAQGLQLGLDSLALDGLDVYPLESRAAVGTVKLGAPVVDLDLQRLSAPPSEEAKASRGTRKTATNSDVEHGELLPEDGRKTAESGWRWRVGKLELANGRVLLHDPAWPQAQAIAPIQASVAGLDSAASAAPAKLALSLADAQGALIKIDGTLNAAARSAKLKAEVAGLKPAPWLGPWQALLPVRVLDGSLALQAQLEADPKSWALQEGALQLSGLQLEPSAGSAAKPSPADKKPGNKRGAATDLLNLPKLEASGVQVHAPSGEALKAQVAALRFEGLDLKLSRGEHGEIAWLPPSKPAAAAGEGKPLRNEKPGPEPQWQIGELQCSACAVALSDRSVQPAAALSLTRTDFTLRKLGSDAKQPANFELALQAGHGGSAKARGELRLQPLALQSHMELAGLDLSVLQPYLDPYLNLTLRSAKAHAAGDLRIDGGAQGGIDVARWRGRMALRELRAVDKINSAEFLRFKNLSLDGADLAWKPAGITADLGTISLDSFYGRVILNADARLNLRDVVKREGREPARSITTPTGPEAAASAAQPAAAAAPAPQAASTPAPEAASAPAPAASAASAPAAAGPPPQLRWKAIHLTAGQIDFTDNFVRPNYSAQLTDVAGEVSGVAWNDPQPANVKISGKVDGSAPLEISGTVHPLGARLQTDITANARGIDITRLSTYSARYAGYGIDKGTLSVRVHYKIDNGKLEAQNNLHLDQLTFGGKVDSPNALKLPVLLAVSLLKDRNGVIDVDLPVSGSLDDPQFSIGGVIARVIVNLIAKALTAPFSLLSHAFSHGSAEELGYIEFAPGTAELSEASIKRLDALTEALNDRPTLKLEVTGRADPAVDTEGLRQVHVEHLMLAAKAKATGELRDSVTIAPAERERWLAAAYKDADIKGKPRNLIGLQKSLPAAEMQALLEQSANAGPTQLGRLADERGDRVKAYLTAKVAPERVLLTASKLGTDGISDQGKTSRVSFDLK